VLKVEDIHTYYGLSHILQGISLAIEPGEVVAVIGRNGVGKTTLVNSIVGFTPPRRGRIVFKGADITHNSSFETVRSGMGLVPQGRRVFPTLSVEENLLVAERSTERHGWNLERVYMMFPRLRERRTQRARTLSGGEQQMLAIGRALMMRPRLLLLDEPSLGLAPIIVRGIFGIVQAINQQDKVTILVVEQNANIALEASGQAYVLEVGRVALSGASAELQKDEAVRRSYLGY